MRLLSLTLFVQVKLEFTKYLNMTENEQVEFSLRQRDYFESSGRLPKTDLFDAEGRLIYSPTQWIDRSPSPSLDVTLIGSSKTHEETPMRKLSESQSPIVSMTMTCPDGKTVCDSTSSTCGGCYCKVVPFTQTVYGKTTEGANVKCVWSNCFCLSLMR